MVRVCLLAIFGHADSFPQVGPDCHPCGFQTAPLPTFQPITPMLFVSGILKADGFPCSPIPTS